MEHRSWHWAEVLFVWQYFTSQAHAHHGATMPATNKRDHTWTPRFSTCNLDAVFDRFCASSQKERFFITADRCFFTQLFCQIHIALIVDHLRRSVRKFVELLMHTLSDFWMAVTGVQY